MTTSLSHKTYLQAQKKYNHSLVNKQKKWTTTKATY